MTVAIDISDEYDGRCFPTCMTSSYCDGYDEMQRILHYEFLNTFTRQCWVTVDKKSMEFCSVVIVFDNTDDLLVFTLKYGDRWKIL